MYRQTHLSRTFDSFTFFSSSVSEMYHLDIRRVFTAIIIASVIALVCFFHYLHSNITNGKIHMPSQSYSVPTYKKSNCANITKWAVTTSDSTTLPLDMTMLFGSMKDWCLLVLTTHPSFSPSHLNNSIYLSSEEIASLPYKVVHITVLNSFNRKNIGYLYAIDNGAKIIFDLEENNTPFMIHEALLEAEKSQHSYMSPRFSDRDISGMRYNFVIKHNVICQVLHIIATFS